MKYLIGSFLAASALAPVAVAQNYQELLPRHLPADRTGVGIVVAGDLDNDGDADLVIAAEEESITILRNQGALRFEPIPSAALAGTDHTTAVALFDLEGDGDLDLAITIADVGGPYSGRILSNDGTGVFTEVTQSVMPSFGTAYTNHMATLDLEGDGDDDLVLSGANLRALVNTGPGTLVNATTTTFPTGGGLGTTIRVADFDLDGDPDLLLDAGLSGSQSSLQLRLNQGGVFGSPISAGLPQFNSSGYPQVCGDIDGDGDTDIVSDSLDVLQVFVNDGTGNFTPGPSPHANPGYVPIAFPALADVVGDPLPDLLGFGPEGLLIYERLPAGIFRSTPIAVDTVTSPYGFGPAIVSLDADGDGDLDLVTSVTDRRARLIVNEGRTEFTDVSMDDRRADMWTLTGPSLIADLNGDGYDDLVDLSADIGNGEQRLVWKGTRWGTPGSPLTLAGAGGRDLAAADLNGDQLLDLVVTDLASPQGIQVFVQAPLGFGDQTLTWLGSVPPGYVDLGDVDGDGDIDLYAGTVYKNQGGSFTPTGPAPTLGTIYRRLVDLDGDGDLDAVEAESFPPRWTWAKNDGTGAFGTPSPPFAGSDPRFADVDGDLDLDVLVTRFLGSNGAQLSLNDGSGNFTDVTATHLPRAAEVGLAQLLDHDGDGDPDILFAVGNSFEWLENDGTGRFTTPAASAVSWFPRATGDLDHDGDTDWLGSTIYDNLSRQLDVPFAPRIGGSLVVEAHMDDGNPTPGRLAAVWIDLSLATTATPTPWGRWQLDGTRAFPLGVIPINGSLGAVSYALPNAPAFAGLTAYLQAIMVDGANPTTWRTSNVVARRLIH